MIASGPDSRPWRAAYLRYRALEHEHRHDEPSHRMASLLLRAAAEGSHVLSRRLDEYRALRSRPGDRPIAEVDESLITELESHADLRSSYDPTTRDFVFEDLYHLALHKLPYWRAASHTPPAAEESVRLYRGQRSYRWDVGASIYRWLPAEGTDTELRRRASTCCRIGRAISSRLGISFLEGVAIAQHYSDQQVLGAPTWLVDFSRDPWVGLFFASHGGQSGDLGVVWDIFPTEWSRHAAGAANPIGGLQFVVPPGVSRIENQSGVFLVAGIPRLFDQYLAFGADTQFHQHDGLVFEDPYLGISVDTIYPPDDPLKPVLHEVKQALASCPCDDSDTACEVPNPVFTDPHSPDTYRRLLSAWLDTGDLAPPGRDLTADLDALARFHASLQNPPLVSQLTNVVSRSLNRLRGAYENLVFDSHRNPDATIRDAIRRAYLDHHPWDDTHRLALLEALNTHCPRTS